MIADGIHRPARPRMPVESPHATWNHPLLGADGATLLRLFSRHRVPPSMWPRVAAMLASAALRAPLGWIERARVAAATDPLADMPPPLFVLGHWRSGTTHLYNLLSRDPRFAWPDPIATGLPWNFLILGRALRPLLQRALPESRLIDNVAVEPDSPQEDEIALASMQSLSYYHALYFPEDFGQLFEPGAFPDAAHPSSRLLARRTRRFRHYCRKLLLQAPGRRLLIKNPIHTGQVAWLRSVFPHARFVHIHRNPYVVFESTRKFYRRLLPAYALQRFDAEAIEPFILDTYPRMHERLYADVAGLPPSRFVEVAYDELDRRPLDCLRRIYRQLELGDFDAVAPRVGRYLEGLLDYQRNPHRFCAADLDRVERAWGAWIERWGYERPV
jgi:hypothetical protein